MKFSYKEAVILVLVSSAALQQLKKMEHAMRQQVNSVAPQIFTSWLSPLCLYLLLNLIIVAIATFSKFHTDPTKIRAVESDLDPSSTHAAFPEPELDPPTPTGIEESDTGFTGPKLYTTAPVTCEATDMGFAGPISNPASDPDQGESMERECLLLMGKAIVTHESHVDGKTSSGSQQERNNESMESIWKRITENRQFPQTMKSETFNLNCALKNSTKDQRSCLTHSLSCQKEKNLIREPLLSPDELNQRVEAFIKKINDDMRLEREQLLNKYKKMVNFDTFDI